MKMLNLLNWQQRMEESRGSKKKEWKRVEKQIYNISHDHGKTMFGERGE